MLTSLLPMLRRSRLALLRVPPRAHGWCRRRWSCAPLALTWHRPRGIAVLAETRRRWRHEIGGVWKRTKLVAKDANPQRVNRLARIRWMFEHLKRGEAIVFADKFGYPVVIQSGLCLDAHRNPSDRHDPRPDSATLPGRGPRSGYWHAASLLGAAPNQRAVPGPPRALGGQ
jgi:hypothetical protein